MRVSFEDDEIYRRKFNTRPFSIKVDKMSEKDIEECIRIHKSHNSNLFRYSTSDEGRNETDCLRRSISVSRSSTSSSNYRESEDDYKEMFHIQECQISLPRISNETNRKGKLAFIFEYVTFFFMVKICFSIAVAVVVLYFL